VTVSSAVLFRCSLWSVGRGQRHRRSLACTAEPCGYFRSDHGRRKEHERAKAPWILKFDIFYYIFSEKGRVLNFEKQN